MIAASPPIAARPSGEKTISSASDKNPGETSTWNHDNPLSCEYTVAMSEMLAKMNAAISVPTVTRVTTSAP